MRLYFSILITFQGCSYCGELWISVVLCCVVQQKKNSNEAVERICCLVQHRLRLYSLYKVFFYSCIFGSYVMNAKPTLGKLVFDGDHTSV